MDFNDENIFCKNLNFPLLDDIKFQNTNKFFNSDNFILDLNKGDNIPSIILNTGLSVK